MGPINGKRIPFTRPVTLVGGGALDRSAFDEAHRRAPAIVAADGAMNRLHAWGLGADAVIGDMDSVDDAVRRSLGDTPVLALAEQDTTDFEKCLYATEAPFYLGVGFTGARLDHTLAVFHGLLSHPEKPVILIGEQEVIALIPAEGVRVGLDPGATVSLFPLRRVTGRRSSGLKWPIDGLELEAGTMIATSNEATAPEIHISFDRSGALLFLPRRYLDALITACCGPQT